MKSDQQQTETNPKIKRVVSLSEVMELLPHRYPFLMLDRYEIIEDEIEGVGIKNVTYNEPQFAGHFPNMPIMPGVLTLEAMAQAAGVAVITSSAFAKEDGPYSVLLTSIDRARFRGIVQPGDQMRLHVKKLSSKRLIWRYEGTCTVGGKIIAQAEIAAMIRIRSDGEPRP